MKLVLREHMTVGEGLPRDRVAVYSARDLDNEYLIKYDDQGLVWRNLRKSLTAGSKWEELPGEYTSAEEAQAALEAR